MNVVLYHANCADGFTAAWAAWKKLGSSAMYIPVQYGQPYPEVIDSGAVEKLYILDFSYPLDVMSRLIGRCDKLIVLDHHASAESTLQEVQHWNRTGVSVVFDNYQSGAALAWRHFHGGNLPLPMPLLVRYVQDRDLWKWELLNSKEVSAAIAARPWNFSEWEKIASDMDNHRAYKMVEEGAAILRYQSQQVAIHCSKATIQNVGGHTVPVLNATTLMSEIGHELNKKFPQCPFSATYFIREDGARVWSLRSESGFDVGALAKQLCPTGGGHKAAAGFEENPIGSIVTLNPGGNTG